MTVKELIEKLLKVKDQDAKVYVTVDNNDGCETCGWGSTSMEEEIYNIDDLETKVWLEF